MPIFCLSPASAILDPDLYIEKSFMQVPTELEDKLNKKVDFNFNKVNLSKMLLLMSKVGDFNIVFPKELDREITIQIKQQSIKNTLEDLSLLYDYEFEFKNNSVVFKSKNLNEHFQLIPLKYQSAALMLNILKEKDFNGVKLNKDPALNNILAVGDIETIRAIEDFIRRVDIAPKQRVFLPEFLSYKSIQRFLKYNLDQKADITAKRIEQNYILLSGKESVVDEVYRRLEEIDKPIPDQAFQIKAYLLSDNLKYQIRRLEPDYQRKGLFRVDADEINFDASIALSSLKVLAAKDVEIRTYEHDFKFSRDVLDLETINLHLGEDETFFNKSSDYALYYISKDDLKKKYLVKKALDITRNQDLVFLIETISNKEFSQSTQL